ncbi:putative lon protease-like [Daphnia sinensis]|uniref:Lon protease-like n=1 Tax=Daphnia sinensis TaxID=1820382 RepID=A0AAD5KFS5_9CRUS|nr:putative lon protease-like [Daphnia sinensis]
MKSYLVFLRSSGSWKNIVGKSVAEALGRKYVRMSLGGLHDESEIRGHRKTYIGAMPGRVVQHLKKAGSANPVFVLDEIDKLGRSNHGDPSSALLEVLDPEQNNAFYDNYIETEFDLSKVHYWTHGDHRSQWIRSKRKSKCEETLVAKTIRAHGISKKELSIDKKTIEKIVENYTNESGVRGLDKQLAKVARNRARQVAVEEKYEVKVTIDHLHDILGAGRERTKYDNNDVPGVVTGLAWTSVGVTSCLLNRL